MTKNYTYSLPEHLIAQAVPAERESCRLMVLDRLGANPGHLHFSDLPNLLDPQTLMVINDTRVIPARIPLVLRGGGAGEVLLEGEVQDGLLKAMARPSKRIRASERLACRRDPECGVEFVESLGDGWWHIRLCPAQLWPNQLHGVGEIPLPPYIKREQGPTGEDESAYQTVFATHPGSSAAPTASLHFSPELLYKLQARGIEIVRITHHVGAGTFLPVKAENPADHVMHSERYHIPSSSARAILAAKAAGRPVLAVGTTVTRALESAAASGQLAGAGADIHGETRLFIYPPYEFRVVDRLITNFHLPESTLLMLVCAFAGRERVLSAYAEAVQREYRFFSYGDAMLLG